MDLFLQRLFDAILNGQLDYALVAVALVLIFRRRQPLSASLRARWA